MIRFVSCQEHIYTHKQTNTNRCKVADSDWFFSDCGGPGAGAYVCVPVGQLQDLQAPVEVRCGEPCFLPATPASHRQGQPQWLHATWISLQIQVELRDAPVHHSCLLLLMSETVWRKHYTSWLAHLVGASSSTSIWGIVCHIKQSLCIYGYSVSMVTWICSYGDWDIPLILFVFFWLLSEMKKILTLEGHLPVICQKQYIVCFIGVSWSTKDELQVVTVKQEHLSIITILMLLPFKGKAWLFSSLF